MQIELIPIRSRSEWLDLRKRDVTASDIAALFGLHPYKSALQVYLEKTGGEPDDADNTVLRRGRILEPGVAVAVAEDRPDWRMEKSTVYIRDADLRIGATPDYFVETPAGRGVLECKSAARDIFERDWQSGPPQGHVLQCLTQMMLAEVKWGVIACLVDNFDKDIFLYDVPRHPGAEDLIRQRVAAFWDGVRRCEMPKPDYARDAAAILSLFHKDKGTSLDLSADNRMPLLLDEHETLKATIGTMKDRLEEVDSEIMHKIGDASDARLPGWRVSFKSQKRKAYSVAETEFRVLRVTNLSGKKETA